MNITDPFGAVADIIVGIYKEKKIQAWVSLVFQMCLSSVVGFLYTCGVALVAKKGWDIAIGSGMIVSASAMFAIFIKSRLTKGMLMVTPEGVQKAEESNDLKEIQK